MMNSDNSHFRDEDVALCVEAVGQLRRREHQLNMPVADMGALGRVGQALQDLADTLEARARHLERLDRITARINAGLTLGQILDNIYEDFCELIPYNRIGLALLEDDGQIVRSYWHKSDGPVRLGPGYAAPLAGSSLETIIATGQPRIISDLEDYLRLKPESKSTRLIVAEGMRSSLTCPLIANGVPVGFLFFSSAEPYVYGEAHSDTFRRIAAQLSVTIEKGRLVSKLAAQKEAIERQNDDLRRLDELKNAFLGVAAHDLRNPLGVVEMAMEVLLDPHVELTDDEIRATMGNILDQTQHMLNLIDNLLDVSIIESGKLELLTEPVGLARFLDKTVERHHLLASTKGISIDLATPVDPDTAITADPWRLRQVMDNLLSNAVKFSPAGGAVRVYAERFGGAWRISVADDGPGIRPEDRARLFQPFTRLSARPTGGERSTGLGLAITQRIVEAHGGQIGVDSVPGGGATFWFTLPHEAPFQGDPA
jgi:hypothetical protein